ncbi:MAG TPA: hypothetical protein VIM55_10405 [Mucilaginibacter sp.]
MRRIIVSILAVAGILTACHSINSRTVAGNYINHAQSQFSIADDTLVIEPAGAENIYHVTRKTGYRRIMNGELDSLRHLLKKMTGTWDESKQQMVILQTGSIFTFTQDGKHLLYGESDYTKQ